jgi:hypothetical protein
MFRSSNPNCAIGVFLYATMFRICTYLASCPKVTALSQWVKQTECETKYSHLSPAKIYDVGNFIPCMQGWINILQSLKLR